MKFRFDNRYLPWGLTAFFVIAASMLFYYGIFQMHTLISGIRNILQILSPIIYGAAIAYILSSVVEFFERILTTFLENKQIHLNRRRKRGLRWFCVISSLLLLLVIIYALIMMVLPQIIRNITNIIYTFPYYAKEIEDWMDTFLIKGWKMDEEMLKTFYSYFNQVQNYLTNNFLPQLQEMMMKFTSGVFDALNVLKNFIVGIIVSLYILADKEIFIAKSKMILYAFMSTERANSTIYTMRFINKTFGGFISGKILDSAIIGVLCYIGVLILDMPYALLVSVIVGVTNVIPFFGPYIGAIPCIFLIMVVSPIKGFYFAIFILVLQQFDGNILGPKILGESTGLSSFMVILSILVGGGLFGIPGMIVGVPVFAVIYAIIWKIMENALRKKSLSAETADYCNMDCMDLQNKTPIVLEEKKKEPTKVFTKEELTNSRQYQFFQKMLPVVLAVMKILKEQFLNFVSVMLETSNQVFMGYKEKWDICYIYIKEKWNRLQNRLSKQFGRKVHGIYRKFSHTLRETRTKLRKW